MEQKPMKDFYLANDIFTGTRTVGPYLGGKPKFALRKDQMEIQSVTKNWQVQLVFLEHFLRQNQLSRRERPVEVRGGQTRKSPPLTPPYFTS